MERHRKCARPRPSLLFCALLLAGWTGPAAADPPACSLEPAPLGSLVVAIGDGQRFYTRIRAADCAGCPQPSDLAPLSLSFRFRFYQGCSTLVRISVVGTDGNAGCPAPDPATVLCPPVEYSLSDTTAEGVVFDLPLAAECCIRGEAFACLEFLDAYTCGTYSPNTTTTTSACTPCQQYVTAAGHAAVDWCLGPMNSFWTRVGADCCTLVPTRPGSWGRVKATYR